MISFGVEAGQVAQLLLPRPMSSLADTLKVVFVGSRQPTKHQLRHVLEVRSAIVREALTWLIENHVDYKRVKLDDVVMRSLPRDGVDSSVYGSVSYVVADKSSPEPGFDTSMPVCELKLSH